MYHCEGINTINHDGELIPCPYMDLSIGNVVKEGLAPVLDRGMLNRWLGPHRDECIIGEHDEFIRFHNQAVKDYMEVSPLCRCPMSMDLVQASCLMEPQKSCDLF